MPGATRGSPASARPTAQTRAAALRQTPSPASALLCSVASCRALRASELNRRQESSRTPASAPLRFVPPCRALRASELSRRQESRRTPASGPAPLRFVPSCLRAFVPFFAPLRHFPKVFPMFDLPMTADYIHALAARDGCVATLAQLVEHTLGKGEVVGSSPMGGCSVRACVAATRCGRAGRTGRHFGVTDPRGRRASWPAAGGRAAYLPALPRLCPGTFPGGGMAAIRLLASGGCGKVAAFIPARPPGPPRVRAEPVGVPTGSQSSSARRRGFRFRPARLRPGR